METLDVSVLQVLKRDLGVESINDLVMAALKDIRDRLDKADIAIKLTDRAQIKYLAHSIRGNLSTCGAAKAAEIALELELKSMDASPEQLQTLYDALESESKQAEALILEYIASPAA